MRGKRKVWAWLVLMVTIGVAIVGVRRVRIGKTAIFLSGAVIRKDTDLKKEIPIADVEISTPDDSAESDCTSDAAGYFRLPLRSGVKPGQSVTLVLLHPGYKPLRISEAAGDKIYVVRMDPAARQGGDAGNHPDVVIANVDVRYSIKSTAVENVGSVVRTFTAVNSGNVPCRGHNPCSPDGKWQAGTGSLSLDAGAGNEFRNARASCIAGPCPFTRLETPAYSNDGRTIRVSALDWSDTATFLLEVEVDRALVSDTGRRSYPVTFGDALTFTLPVGAEGVFIEAEMNGTPIVFPLGPDLLLSWADCSARLNRDRTKACQCALKPGYRFQ